MKNVKFNSHFSSAFGADFNNNTSIEDMELYESSKLEYFEMTTYHHNDHNGKYWSILLTHLPRKDMKVVVDEGLSINIIDNKNTDWDKTQSDIKDIISGKDKENKEVIRSVAAEKSAQHFRKSGGLQEGLMSL